MEGLKLYVDGERLSLGYVLRFCGERLDLREPSEKASIASLAWAGWTLIADELHDRYVYILPSGMAECFSEDELDHDEIDACVGDCFDAIDRTIRQAVDGGMFAMAVDCGASDGKK
ncbi:MULTISPECIES: hypothetical protein [Bifidobacterium]|uniref:hypothetical protein n=1 Tax=Bifidobacterium TaxID=1678 RepID=UPI000E511012|nr:hypothetical protein [Bifidobacterium pseudocatenulatum]RGX32279.1 hypothetical protein DWV26_03210 [Bifidobacterium pseudocatenulatum]UDG86129.1 hypothetical protein KYE72_07630 [Bifidobacterium pseudocatenulatum]